MTEAVHIDQDQFTTSALDAICDVPQWTRQRTRSASVISAVNRRCAEDYTAPRTVGPHTRTTPASTFIQTPPSALPMQLSRPYGMYRRMSSNHLKLNADKTQFTWLGIAPQLMKVNNRTVTGWCCHPGLLCGHMPRHCHRQPTQFHGPHEEARHQLLISASTTLLPDHRRCKSTLKSLVAWTSCNSVLLRNLWSTPAPTPISTRRRSRTITAKHVSPGVSPKTAFKN